MEFEFREQQRGHAWHADGWRIQNGRGEFFDQEDFNGRPVLVRFIISDIKPESCKFEQSFSTDGGKTWEANWIAIDTRVKE